MKLVEVQITNFRNILDSSDVSIDPTVTCLVGKNESGKTAFLHALYRLHPARPNVKLSAPDQYPAWLEKRDRLRGVKIEDFQPVRATFLIEAADRSAVEKIFGSGVLRTDSLGLERSYGGTLFYSLTLTNQRSCDICWQSPPDPAPGSPGQRFLRETHRNPPP